MASYMPRSVKSPIHFDPCAGAVSQLAVDGRAEFPIAAFTLAHLSDPHLPPMPVARFRDLAGKRALGYLNWTRNRHKYHRREVLDALVADMQAQQPDHIAVTGDLVNLALEARIPRRPGAGSRASGTPQQVTVVPGNHDAYVASAGTASPATLRRLSARRCRGRWRAVSVPCAGADRWR